MPRPLISFDGVTGGVRRPVHAQASTSDVPGPGTGRDPSMLSPDWSATRSTDSRRRR
ncbi:hypothetical protein ACFQZ4_42485 [Catellatospora coxensis]